MFEQPADFGEFAAMHYGLGPDALKELNALDEHRGVASIVASWAKKLAEAARVDAITAQSKSRCLESLGRWKGLEEFGDYVTNRLNDFDSLRSEWLAFQNPHK